MQRIPVLVQKLAELSEKEAELTAIDVDLMLDYTRVLYADLLELRKTVPASIGSNPEQAPAPQQPTEQDITPEPVIRIDTSEVPAIDIRTVIGINDKYLFISELFRDDRNAYDAAIRQLNTFTNLQEAMRFAENELQNKYDWDREDATVQAFYTLLSSSFPSM